MDSCIFCSIIAQKIPSTTVYEDEQCVAFLDITPQAKQHIVLIPKKHMASLAEASIEDLSLLGHCLLMCDQVAKDQGIATTGYRVVTNIGVDARQSVQHLHFHILGGEQLSASMV